MPYPPDIDRILRAVGKLETRLNDIADGRARRHKIIDDSRTTRHEQIEQAYGERPTRAELDHDDILVKIKAQEQDLRRDHAIQSLAAVIEFVSRGLGRPNLDHGFLDLWLALINAAAGAKHDVDWLSRRPSKGSGRPAASFKDEMMRGAIAAVQEVLCEGGLETKDAAKFVLKHFPRDILDPLLPDSAHIDSGWKTVREWRDGVIPKNVRKARISRKDSFRYACELPVSGETPEQRAHSLIDMIVRAAKQSD